MRAERKGQRRQEKKEKRTIHILLHTRMYMYIHLPPPPHTHTHTRTHIHRWVARTTLAKKNCYRQDIHEADLKFDYARYQLWFDIDATRCVLRVESSHCRSVEADIALYLPHGISHSDSLDTLLYVRFAIQNLEFYEWKLGDHGWALS